jgi:hypothetical protein
MTAPGGNGSSDPRTRAEMDDAPPFLTWRAIYVIVLGALAAEILLAFALVS